MRKFLISAALAATTLTAAAPAAAQWAPAPAYGNSYGSPYGSPYGNAYGYNNYGQIRSLQARIDQLQWQIRRLDQRNILSDREAARLMSDARAVEHRLRETARYGLNSSERRAVEVRIARLEQQMWRDARDGNRWGDRRYGDRDWDRDRDWSDRDRDWSDRDRDGRDDRWEDDRGRDHDD